MRLQILQILIVGNDIGSLAVFENQLDAVCWIVRVTGDVCCTSLHDTKHGEDKATGTRQQHGHAVATLHTMSNERIGYTVHLTIQLAESKGAVAGYESLHVGLLLGIRLNGLMEQTGRNICCASHTERIDQTLLFVAKHRHLEQTVLRCLHEMFQNADE